MLLRNVYTKSLWDGRRALAGWTVGTTAVAAAYAAFYPQLAGGGAMAEMVAGFSPAMREAFRMQDISSAAGYLGSSVFGLIVPLLMICYGAATGARAVAGDEESGYLDVLLTHPVSRARFFLERFAALAAGAVAIGAVLWLALLGIRGAAELESVSVAQFAGQCLNTAMLGVVFGALALAVGAAFGGRTLALGVTAGVGVAAYVANTFAGQLGVDWLRYLSPLHYYIGGEPLRHGVQWADAGVLALLAAALVAAGTWTFTTRDLRT
ncbi:ABC-2 type transport system permease protein [Amycolatopsis arida]|uniref:ABC-2 type transport system permease protein n=1 Tax=Amycolatopsis arida TaxID=587909 RepID=A0A1I5WD00_9PSEU|nr:ABC transporter permease subunit [Amycolatopsis arida]TDX92221.1 ABC-2 type transport system permease protein [Amycolatopsis arida]SFQ17541.1 ABC-2 type transport system permease protein [Amycolatopsis arida]